MKKFSVTLKRSDVLLSIEENAYIIAESAAGLDDEGKSGVKDITQDGRGGRITTLMNMSWGALLHSLSGYAKRVMDDDICVSNKDYDKGDYEVILEVHDDFNAVNTNVVFYLIYDFMVNRTLGRYFSIAKKDEAENYLQCADRNLIDVKKCLAAPIKKRKPIAFF